jgi:hypothetical protein
MNKSLMMYQIFITPLNPPDVLEGNRRIKSPPLSKGRVRVGYNYDKNYRIILYG